MCEIHEFALLDPVHKPDVGIKKDKLKVPMIETKIVIINKLGLHARASAKFVATAARFQSRIDVTKDGKTINGKSIMGVMMLAANMGSELLLQIDGPDETEMTEAMTNLINNRFGEAE